MRKTRWTIALVVALLCVVFLSQGADYIGAAKCRMCHRVEYASWQEKAHSRAFEQLPVAEQANATCLKCHAVAGSADLPGVQCESCHGPGSEYKAMSVMKDHEASLAAGLMVPDEGTCRACHEGAPHDQKPFDYAAMRDGGIHEVKAR